MCASGKTYYATHAVNNILPTAVPEKYVGNDSYFTKSLLFFAAAPFLLLFLLKSLPRGTFRTLHTATCIITLVWTGGAGEESEALKNRLTICSSVSPIRCAVTFGRVRSVRETRRSANICEFGRIVPRPIRNGPITVGEREKPEKPYE